MEGQVPDPAEFWAALAKASPEEVAAALRKAGLLSPEQLRPLQDLVAGAQSPDHQPQGPVPTVDAPAREEVGAQIGPYPPAM